MQNAQPVTQFELKNSTHARLLFGKHIRFNRKGHKTVAGVVGAIRADGLFISGKWYNYDEIENVELSDRPKVSNEVEITD